MPRARVLCLAAALLAAVALPAAAEQWKWRDASGRVNVSDRPPPASVPEKDILQRPVGPARAPAPATAAAAPAAASAAGGVDADLEERKRKAERDEEAKRKSEEAAAAARKKAEEQRIATEKADNCARARAHLRAIEEGQRLSKVDANGERVVFDDRMRADEAARTRAIIASDCR